MNASQIREILIELKELFLLWRLKKPLLVHCGVVGLIFLVLIFRLFIIPLILLFTGGFVFGLFLLSPETLCPNLFWIYARVNKKSDLKDEKPAIKSCHVCGKEECGRHRSELNIQSFQPWLDIQIPEKVNEALEEFLNLIFKEYIHNWYSDLSSDESFVDEIKVTLRFVLSVIFRRLRKVDIPAFISNKVLPLSLKHLHYCLKVVKSQEERLASNEGLGKDISESTTETTSHDDDGTTDDPTTSLPPDNNNIIVVGTQLEQLILESYGHYLHCAARTRRSELDYLKQVADKIFLYVLPPASLKSKSFYAFMRELVTGAILLPAMDLVGDPDIVNNLLLLYLDKSPLEECKDPPSPLVSILQGFSQRSSTFQNQKNLQLKLSNVLSEPEMLFPFMQFMKAEASVNVLQFYLVIEEFNRKILTPELTPEKLDELHRELQKLYENYFDPQAHDCIRFDPDITAQIKQICEGSPDGVIKLQTTTPLFRAYEQAYDLLEHNFLPLFHQSDIYYTMLCGERMPSKLNRNNSKVIKRGSTTDSLARLSSKIKCVFKSSAVDGSLIMDDDYEVEEVDDPLMNEEFFLQVPSNANRLAESPTSLSGEDSAFLLTGNGGVESQGKHALRNLSLWVVSIPSVVTKVDPSDPNNPKKFFYVFRVEVKRLAEDRENTLEPEEWSIERRYHEFYVLETKLKEFHGEFEDAQLPAKKTFVPKNKIFFETLRCNLESFLRILLTKPNLRGSQLVHSFLTSDQEFTTSFLDVNLGKKVKSGAMKLVKERGQHLEPFLKSFLQSTETPKSKPVKMTDRDSDTLSISSEKMINSIYNNNANIEDLPLSVSHPKLMSNDDEGSYFDALLYLTHAVFKAPEWTMQVLLSVRMVLRNTVDTFLDWFIAKKLDQVFAEHYIIKVVNLLKDVLFDDNDPPRTEEEKKERQMQALKELTDFIPKIYIKTVGPTNYKHGIGLIFDLLQLPCLNKQLSYMLLDALLQELFPELLSEPEPSRSGGTESKDARAQKHNANLRKRQIKSI